VPISVVHQGHTQWVTAHCYVMGPSPNTSVLKADASTMGWVTISDGPLSLANRIFAPHKLAARAASSWQAAGDVYPASRSASCRMVFMPGESGLRSMGATAVRYARLEMAAPHTVTNARPQSPPHGGARTHVAVPTVR
jgi:hypothetical protein